MRIRMVSRYVQHVTIFYCVVDNFSFCKSNFAAFDQIPQYLDVALALGMCLCGYKSFHTVIQCSLGIVFFQLAYIFYIHTLPH